MCSSVVLTCITVVECSTGVLVLVLLYYSVVQRCTEARSTSRCIHVVDVLSSSTSVVDVLSSTRTYYMYYNCSTWRAPCTIPTSDCYLSHVSQPAMHHPYFFVPTLSGHSRKRPYFVQNPRGGGWTVDRWPNTTTTTWRLQTTGTDRTLKWGWHMRTASSSVPEPCPGVGA